MRRIPAKGIDLHVRHEARNQFVPPGEAVGLEVERIPRLGLCQRPPYHLPGVEGSGVRAQGLVWVVEFGICGFGFGVGAESLG